MHSFSKFLDHKGRENKKHLNILKKILSKAGFEVLNYLSEDEPHLFVNKPSNIDKQLERLSFQGVRVYTRGKMICFRCQMKPTTEPFGEAYEIDVDGMYKSLMGDKSDKVVSFQMIYMIIKELREFFLQSLEAERIEDRPSGQIGSVMVAGGDQKPDYSSQVYNPKIS